MRLIKSSGAWEQGGKNPPLFEWVLEIPAVGKKDDSQCSETTEELLQPP